LRKAGITGATNRGRAEALGGKGGNRQVKALFGVRSGGPLMTVKAVRPSAESADSSGAMWADVDWFDVNQPHHGAYPLTSLRKVSSK